MTLFGIRDLAMSFVTKTFIAYKDCFSWQRVLTTGLFLVRLQLVYDISAEIREINLKTAWVMSDTCSLEFGFDWLIFKLNKFKPNSRYMPGTNYSYAILKFILGQICLKNQSSQSRSVSCVLIMLQHTTKY